MPAPRELVETQPPGHAVYLQPDGEAVRQGGKLAAHRLVDPGGAAQGAADDPEQAANPEAPAGGKQGVRAHGNLH